jgi:hypothetical protein
MAMMTPALMAPLKKEATHLLGYSRSRPHFKFRLAVDAILSMALVFGAFQLATAPSRHGFSDELKNSGAVAFSAKELEKFVKDEDLAAYWAGPQAKYKYTIIATTPGEVTISYFPKNADIGKVDTSILEVQTHMRTSTDQAQAYSQNFLGLGSFLVNQGSTGNVIEYNAANPTEVMVSFKNQSSTVTIFSSVPEEALTLAMKPGVIQKISQI